MSLHRSLGKWQIVKSSFLIKRLIRQLNNKSNFNNSKEVLSESKYTNSETISKININSKINSVQEYSFVLSSTALIRVPIYKISGTDVNQINRSFTNQYLGVSLFNEPAEGKFVNTTGGDYISITTDYMWNRIIYGSINHNWTKSYAEHSGENYIQFASDLGIDMFGNIFVLGDFPTKVYRLKYDESIQKISFVCQVPVQGVTEISNLCLDNKDTPDIVNDDSFWLTDKSDNAIFNFTWSGQLLGKYTRVKNPSTNEEITFIRPTKIIAYYYLINGSSTLNLALIDNDKKRIIIINNISSFQNDMILGDLTICQFTSDVSLNSIGFFDYEGANGLWIADGLNGMFHIVDAIDGTGYLGSIKTINGQQQWSTPRGLSSCIMSNSSGGYAGCFTLDQWDDSHGINFYYAGSDLVGTTSIGQIINSSPTVSISTSALTLCNVQTSLYNSGGSLIKNFYSYIWTSGKQQTEPILPSDVTSDMGKYRLRLSVTPINNSEYPSDYQQQPLNKDVWFAFPLTGADIEGPECSVNGVRLTWNTSVNSGSGDFNYYWYIQNDGSNTQTLVSSGNSSFTEVMPSNGFTLTCKIHDNFNSNEISVSQHVSSITTSGTLTSNETWSGSINLSGTVTVPSGLTLTINSATISIPSGVSIIADGVLHANGCTFTAQSGNSANSWNNIELYGGGASGSYIKNSHINYGNGAQIINVPNFEISNCSFSNNQIAIHISGSAGSILDNSLTSNSNGHSIFIENYSTVTCSGNNITKTGSGQHQGSGIQFNASSGTVIKNIISYCNWGIGAIWGSSPTSDLGMGVSGVKNNDISNCSYGFIVYRDSYPTFGIMSAGDHYGGNSIYNNTKNTYVGMTYTQYSCGLNACYNWWGNSPPNTSLFSVGSNAYLNYSTLSISRLI